MEIHLTAEELGNNTFTQTCYMSVELMQKLEASIRSCIQITIGLEKFLCVIYPKHGITSEIIMFSKAVMKCDKKMTNSNAASIQSYSKKGITGSMFESNNSVDGTSCSSIMKNMKIAQICSNSLSVRAVGNAKKINIIVVLCDKNKLKHFHESSNHLKRLQEHCGNCLNGIIVSESFTVDLRNMRLAKLYGISYICIENIKCAKKYSELKCFCVTSNTEIKIEKLHSLEWYEHMRDRSDTSYLGGLTEVTSELLDLIKMPIIHSSAFHQLGVKPPKGILLRGPPGCGKTSLVKHAAYLAQAYLLVINGPEVLGALPGETESNLEKMFNAGSLMSKEGPCILFIDEIDSLCPRSLKGNKLQQGRVTGKLVSLLDGLQGDGDLVVIGATNRPSVLDPAIRRPGRMDREISINPPTMKQRREILRMYVDKLPVTSDLDLDMMAEVTNGYVGADLASLCQEAAYLAMAAHGQEITKEDFMTAFKKIRPSLQRGTEGLVDLRPVYWSDIGGLESVKADIKQAVEWPLKHPEAFRRMGLMPSKGVLLYGPPGCCKTTLVRAAATSCHATFLSISGAQLYSPYVGDSERLLSETFQKARLSSPSIIFLDEIDSIVGKRSESGRSGVQERVLSTLLNEMDGVGIKLSDSYGSSGHQKMLEGEHGIVQENTDLESKDLVVNQSVLLVAATNRPDLLDEALIRPGRIDKIIYVPHPDLQARREILKVYSKTMGVCDDDLDFMSNKTDFYTGADLENLCREAALCALTETMDSCEVHLRHFMKALNSVKPSLNDDLIKQYSKINMSPVK